MSNGSCKAGHGKFSNSGHFSSVNLHLSFVALWWKLRIELTQVTCLYGGARQCRHVDINIGLACIACCSDGGCSRYGKNDTAVVPA